MAKVKRAITTPEQRIKANEDRIKRINIQNEILKKKAELEALKRQK